MAYRAWHRGDEEQFAREIDVLDVADEGEVAELYAEKWHNDGNYDGEHSIDVCVRAPDGTLSEFTVYIEFEPTFNAYDREEPADAESK